LPGERPTFLKGRGIFPPALYNNPSPRPRWGLFPPSCLRFRGVLRWMDHHFLCLLLFTYAQLGSHFPGFPPPTPLTEVAENDALRTWKRPSPFTRCYGFFHKEYYPQADYPGPYYNPYSISSSHLFSESERRKSPSSVSQMFTPPV